MEDRFSDELDRALAEFQHVITAMDCGNLEGRHENGGFLFRWRVRSWMTLPRVVACSVCTQAPLLDPASVASALQAVSSVRKACVCGMTKKRQREMARAGLRHDPLYPVISLEIVVSTSDRINRLSEEQLAIVKKLLVEGGGPDLGEVDEDTGF